MPTVMSYGSYQFSPVPLISFQHVFNRAGDGGHFASSPSYNVKATLNGTITNIYPTGAGNNFANGITEIMPAQSGLYNALLSDGQLFYLECGGTPLFSGYPKINSFNFDQSNNNWVLTTPYTIEMEFEEWSPVDTGSRSHRYVTAAQDEWNFEFDDKSYFSIDLSGNVPAAQQYSGYSYVTDANPFFARLTHNLSANGVYTYGPSGGGIPGWKNAQDYVMDRLGYDSVHAIGSGVINMSKAVPYNHIRTRNTDELNGVFSVTESWLLMDTGNAPLYSGLAIEDYTTNIKTSMESDITSVGIEGTIVGLEDRSYHDGSGTHFTINSNKYNNALSYWNSIRTRLLPRVQSAVQGIATRNINFDSISQSINYLPFQGTISYGYEYDDRPSNCISGALAESIVITDTNPADVVASLSVLGRTAGPVLQSIGTKTQRTRDLSVEVTMAPSTGCSYASLYGSGSTNPSSQVKTLFLCPMETEMTGSQSQVFVSADNETWNPKTGRYTRNVTWLFQNCSDTTTPSACGSGTNEDII